MSGARSLRLNELFLEITRRVLARDLVDTGLEEMDIDQDEAAEFAEAMLRKVIDAKQTDPSKAAFVSHVARVARIALEQRDSASVLADKHTSLDAEIWTITRVLKQLRDDCVDWARTEPPERWGVAREKIERARDLLFEAIQEIHEYRREKKP